MLNTDSVSEGSQTSRYHISQVSTLKRLLAKTCIITQNILIIFLYKHIFYFLGQPSIFQVGFQSTEIYGHHLFSSRYHSSCHIITLYLTFHLTLSELQIFAPVFTCSRVHASLETGNINPVYEFIKNWKKMVSVLKYIHLKTRFPTVQVPDTDFSLCNQ